jgi:TonB family protein
MNSLLLYFAQSSACLLLFYGFYLLVLRRERSFQFNRFYLLGTPLLALTLPLLRIPVAEPVAEATWVYVLPAQEATIVVAAPEEESLAWAAVLPWLEAGLYLAGVLYFSFRLLRQLSLVRNLLRSRRHLAFRWQDCTVVPTSGNAPTFSFLRYIFFNEQPPVSEQEKLQILEHERVHVRQRHSLDVLYLAGLQIALWVNPLLLLYQKALAETHEYIADDEVVRSGHGSVQSYAQLVVRQLFWRLERPIGSFFSSSQTLNRIAMLKNPASSPKRWKQLLVLPMLAVSVLLFAFQRSPLGIESSASQMASVLLPQSENGPADQKGYTAPADSNLMDRFNQITIVTDHPLSRHSLNPSENLTHSQPVSFKGGFGALSNFMDQNVTLASALKQGQGSKVTVSLVVKEDGTLSDVSVTKSSRPDVDQAALRAVRATSGKWNPAIRNGKPISSTITLIFHGIKSDSSKSNPNGWSLVMNVVSEDKPYSWVEKMPMFRGDDKELMKYLGQNIKYPEAARKAGIEGLVVLSFTVEVNGTVSDIEVIKKLAPDLDEEAVRVVKTMSGEWKPGMQDGKPVPVKFTLPIRFDVGQPTDLAAKTSGTREEIMPDRRPMEFLSRNIRYPASAVKEGAEGLVLVTFELSADGALRNVQIEDDNKNKLHPDLRQEAERVVKASSGQWKALAQSKATTPTTFVQPIRFVLKYAEENSSIPARVSAVDLREERVQADILQELVVVGYPPEGESRTVQMPSFRGGPDELNRHIRQRLTFATPASQRPMDGVVTISVVVNPDGTLSQVKMVGRKFKNIKVIGESSMNYMDPKEFDGGQRKLINDLSQQALDIVRATSGKWIPAQKNGQPQKSSVTLEIPIKYP